MIRVIVTGPATGGGFYPYRVDWWSKVGQSRIVGLSQEPLMDACRQLQQLGVMDSTVVALFDDEAADPWTRRTTVGYGAREAVRRLRGDYSAATAMEEPPVPEERTSELPNENGTLDPLQELLAEDLDAGVPSSALPPAKSEAPRPPPHILPKHPKHKASGHAKPSKPRQSHPKRPRTKSAAPRGSSSRR
jgi:hypothetical protein